MARASGAAEPAVRPVADLYLRTERQVPKLAHTMIDRFVEEIPLYALLPREQLEGEILAITDRNLRVFFATLRENRLPDDDELAEIRTSAARRAEERIPVDAVLTAYHVGARIGYEALAAEAREEEKDDLIASLPIVLAYLQAVSAAVSSAYLEEQQAISGEERDARRGFVSAVLSGASTEAYAGRLGMRVAPAYVVLWLAIEAHPDELDAGVGGAVSGRRKVRRIQSALDAWAGESVLGLLEPSGGAALLPTTSDEADGVVTALPALVHDLMAAAGTELVAGASIAHSEAELRVAADQARDVVRLARLLERPPGAYRLFDVLLEYQLTRPSAARSALAGLLDPLDGKADLPRTLETYLENDLDRRGTAAALHVHPNTLDYRLRRIIELTGLDPATTRGLQLLSAAVTARRLSG